MRFILLVCAVWTLFNFSSAQDSTKRRLGVAAKAAIESPVVASRDNNQVFILVQQAPSFPGGDAAIVKLLHEHVTNPVQSLKKDDPRKVLVRFIVERDGSLSDFKVTQSAGPGLDAEALKVAKLLPKFQPGKQDGYLARVYFTLPVVFH